MGDWAVVPASDWSVVDAPVDMGPEARRRSDVSGGMRPEPKSDDDITVASDYAKHDVRKTLQGINDRITTPEVSQAQKARAQAEDPIRNDPLAGMIVQGIPAAGLGVVAGGLTRYVAPGLAPLVQGSTTGAASSPDNPALGAVIGAIPGLGSASRAVDNAIGESALAHVRPAGSPPSAVAQFAGKWLGAGAGHSVGGLPGAAAGHYFGGKVATAASAAADNVTNALAERYLNQQADQALAGQGLVHFGDAAAPPVGSAPMVNLAPLAPAPVDPYAAARRIGPNDFDAIDMPGAPASNHATVGDATNAGGKTVPTADVLSVPQEKAFHELRYGAGAENRAARESFPDMGGETRLKALADLGDHTQVRDADGQREFLLYRGDSADSSGHQLTELSNWTPNKPVAQKFANLQPGGGQVHEAWIPEDQIKAIPRFWGAKGSDLTEHEVWVKPSRTKTAPPSALADPAMDEFSAAIMGTGGKALPPSLRDDVVRSAKAFRGDPYDTDAPVTPNVEDQLARSVRMFGQLKSAKAAGKLTPTDIQEAVRGGLSPVAVAKVVGQDAFDSAMGK
jgi:hypothetical protein